MLFKPELIDQIVKGHKTQTRRPFDPRKYDIDTDKDAETILAVLSGGKDWRKQSSVKWRTRWAVGRDYAVQPGRGKPGVWWWWGLDQWVETLHPNEAIKPEPLRIRITRIRIEDVRKISHDDAIAEGFQQINEFMNVWMRFYDKPALKAVSKMNDTHEMWDCIRNRPADRYLAVVLDFEIASGGKSDD